MNNLPKEVFEKLCHNLPSQALYNLGTVLEIFERCFRPFPLQVMICRISTLIQELKKICLKLKTYPEIRF